MLRYIVAWFTVDWEHVREPREAVGKKISSRVLDATESWNDI